jgi:2-methylcitrate dehydratase
LNTDPLTADIATYVAEQTPASYPALTTAWLALFDSLGCAMAATRVPECMALVGPSVPGMTTTPGVRIPGTSYRVDPVAALSAPAA